MKSISLNIALLPERRARDRAISISKRIAREAKTEFILNTKNYLPHVTLYQARYPHAALPKLKRLLLLTARNIKPFRIKMDGCVLSFKAFLFWNCRKSVELRDLQKEIVLGANPLREGLILSHLSSLNNLSPKDLKDIARYGSLYILKNYRPHITIARITDASDAPAIIEMMKKVRASFQAREFILGYLGKHGSVRKVIATFPFRKP